MSWVTPIFTPANYAVLVDCFRLCDNVPTLSGNPVIVNIATNYTLTPLDPGNFCSVKVTAVYGATRSESKELFTTTLTDS